VRCPLGKGRSSGTSISPGKMRSLVVDEEEPIEEIINFAEQPSSRGTFLVDRERRLKGVITRLDLLNWAKFKPGEGIDLGRIGASISDIRRYVYSAAAREFANEYSYSAHVKPDDIISALNLMISSNLIDVPVVDEQGKILGDLKRTS